MASFFTHVERVRAKPHHIRRQVAFGVAGAITGIIGVSWLGVSLATGAFALQGAGFADAMNPGSVETVPTGEAAGLAGAGASGDTQGAARITIVPAHDSEQATTTNKQTSPGNQTIIPF